MSDLQFVDELPTVTRTRKSKWSVIGDQLRTHPGKWAIVSTSDVANRSYATASEIKNGRLKLGGGRFEAVVRTAPNGDHVVYARLLGDEEQAA